ncbi:MAG: NAD(P)/FAD-dependent oxidoreductase, partial [Chloroflexi bacterium]|nr:NAD(P)/FAD-dependent oxidoreductase [Chloroflexota bacterium]
PGFVHDVCAAIYPLGAASPFFRGMPLATHGLEWLHSPSPLAHPLDNGTAVLLERSIEATAKALGRDAAAYGNLMAPFVAAWDKLADDLLGRLALPRHPFTLARFGLHALRSARGLAESKFKTEQARALFAGMATHAALPLEQPPTAAFGLVLGIVGHTFGWPMARGGSQKVADALASHFRSLGGEIITGVKVDNVDGLPTARAVLFDVTPHQLLKLAGHHMPRGYGRKLQGYRHGPGVFKVDWALDGTIPWKAKECMRAATVHVGGTLSEIAASERKVWMGEHPEDPFLVVAQQSLFDRTRAPEGKQTVWAYCHVPNGSTFDMTQQIENQMERFAPGFLDRVLARSVIPPAKIEQYNANCVGGDITGGVHDLRQLWTRPTLRIVPYSTPAKGLYICSSSTPPGVGVHGMCGYLAARVVLREVF